MQQRIIIVGASSGIGKELALQFAERGDVVGITGRRCELLAEIKNRFTDRVYTACFDATALTNIESLERLIEEMNGVDIFIYNAGGGEISETLNASIEQNTLALNVQAFLDLTVYMFNYFVKQGHGHVVATSSIASKRGNSFAPAYSASKAFVSNYLEGLHMKAKKLKMPLYVTDVQPGFVKTKMAQGNKQFWVAPPPKAAKQIIHAIDTHKWRVYVTKRWKLIGKLLPLLPDWLYHRIA